MVCGLSCTAADGGRRLLRPRKLDCEKTRVRQTVAGEDHHGRPVTAYPIGYGRRSVTQRGREDQEEGPVHIRPACNSASVGMEYAGVW